MPNSSARADYDVPAVDYESSGGGHESNDQSPGVPNIETGRTKSTELSPSRIEKVISMQINIPENRLNENIIEIQDLEGWQA